MLRGTLTVAGFCAFIAVSSLVIGAETELTKPPAIQVQDVPSVPAAFAARLAQYQNIRSASFAGWSPEPVEGGILIRTRFANAPQLHRVLERWGQREQITFFDEPVDGRFIPQAKDGAILLSISTGGSENDQIYLLDREKFSTTLLTDGKSRNRIDAIRPDGKLMVVGSNQRNGRDTDLFLADPRKPGFLRTLLQVDSEHWRVADWSQDGKMLLLTRYVSINESYPAVMDLESGKLRKIPLPGGEKAAVGAFEFAGQPDRAYIVLDSGSEFRRLALMNLSTGECDWLSSDIPWDVNELAVHDDSGRAVFTVNADGATDAYLLESKQGELPARRQFLMPKGGIAGGLEFSPDGKRLGFTFSSSREPADPFSIDMSSGDLERWTWSEVGGLNRSRFVSAKAIRFSSFDGREIPAWYYRPPAASPDKKVPVLIQIHGGPESQAQPTFSAGTQFYVNELGLAVLLPNVRGSAGYGKTYLQLDNAERREDSVKDIGALLDWIAQQPELDASRVAVTGGSYGGFMVLSSLTHFGPRIKAGIDVVGICNFNTFLANTSAYRADLRRAEYGDERNEKMRAVFEQISPANHADKIVSALLVAHGRNDPRVPFSEAEHIAAKVRSHGRTVWTVFADNEGHGFAKKDNVDYLRAVEAYFLKQSLGIE